MKLTDADIAEFQALYRQKFGKEIGKPEALDKATSLVLLMHVIYCPVVESDQGNKQ